ncbi:MAG: histidine phosphatase family protein [Phycisphaerales bacterium]|nr:histidine phosphatase family protein [Phycisphaerales bacterium]
MSKLILIKHAPPEKDADTPSHQWGLSAQGQQLSRIMAGELRQHAPQIIISSLEPKALQTAQIIARELAIPVETDADLAEHERNNVPLMETRDFISLMALLFNRPRQLVLGQETAEQAKKRITKALHRIFDQHPDQTIAVMTHGTVLALYASELIDEDPFTLWRKLALPSYLVFSRPQMELLERRDRLDH